MLSRLVGDALHDLQLPWQKLAVPHSQFELQCEFLCHAREKYPGRSEYERLPSVLSVGLRMDVDIFPFRAYRIQYESYILRKIESNHPKYGPRIPVWARIFRAHRTLCSLSQICS